MRNMEVNYLRYEKRERNQLPRKYVAVEEKRYVCCKMRLYISLEAKMAVRFPNREIDSSTNKSTVENNRLTSEATN